MTQAVLITGGCGFIGSHLVDRLIERGYSVVVLDLLDPQVHPGGRPDYLNAKARYHFGDVRDAALLSRALDGVDAVVHLAAAVGVGQSMYQIEHYVGTNSLGTASLLEALVERRRSIRKLVVASSMSVYGEGPYRCRECGPVPGLRRPQELERGVWEPSCGRCGRALEPSPTPEDHRIDASSVYALTKLDQEKLCLSIGQAYGVPAVALRLFNVYGPRQALSNPYTGVAAIFSSRIKAGEPPMAYEDGRQRRDFVSVFDVVEAFVLALENGAADGRTLNVASGRSVSILELAEILLAVHGEQEIRPVVLERYRQGDVRHCFADISAIRELGYRPAVDLEEGLRALNEWTAGVEAVDRFDTAQHELRSRGLA